MIRVLQALYGRFRRAHESLVARPLAHDGAIRAEATLPAGFLHVTGQAAGGRAVVLSMAGGPDARMDNPDPAGRAPFGFSFILPWDQEAIAPLPACTLTLAGDSEEVFTLDWPSRRLHGLALRVRFLIACAQVLPAAYGWYRKREPRYRTAIRRALGLEEGTGFGPLDPALLPQEIPPETTTLPAGLVVVIPVYNAFDVLQDCLARVAAHTDLPWRVVLVDDASPDPRIRPALQDWLAGITHPQFCGGQLCPLDENKGFVGAANLGLSTARAMAPDWPVVLLNTDAFVPAGWAARLLAPLADPAVASVTPFSNAAELMSVPAIGGGREIGAGMADRLDRMAQNFPPRAPSPRADMPTGVGFCMAMAPQFLTRVPQFDTAFGKGYGEEVDWCRKTAAMGGRHVAADRLFVEHRGGASFGSATKQAAIARSSAVISRRYPAFDGMVQAFVTQDPLRTQRLVLGLALAADLAGDDPVPVWIAHNMGGGAEFWLREQIAATSALGQLSVVIRVGGLQRWQVELHGASGVTGATMPDFAQVAELLALLPRKAVTYSCAVGDSDPLALPAHIRGLCGPDDRLAVVMHDYFPVSPSFTLVDSDGLWRGVPIGGERRDRAHETSRPDGRKVSLADWQETWGALLRNADAITVFDDSGAKIIRAVWPDLDPARIHVRPHAMPPLPPPVAKPQGKPVIGMLGNLNPQKGGAVVLGLGKELAREGVGIVLIGDIDPNLARPKGLVVHGPYARADIGKLVARYGITHWIFPALWPETFSYTMREILATGLPVMALDLGAQGAAAAAAPNGVVIPYGTIPEIVSGYRKALADLGV